MRLMLQGCQPREGLFLDSFLAPGGHQRLEAYLKRQGDLQSMDGTYIVDISQWPDSQVGTAGPYFPSQLTHGTIVNCDGFHHALGTDHLAANGFHMYPETAQDHFSHLAPILRRLGNSEQKELSGNGQNLPAIAAWFMYVFCHTVRKPKLSFTTEPSALSKGNSTMFDGCAFDEDAGNDQKGHGVASSSSSIEHG